MPDLGSLVVPIDCPNCREPYRVRVPIDGRTDDGQIIVNVDHRHLHLAVHAHLRQHES